MLGFDHRALPAKDQEDSWVFHLGYLFKKSDNDGLPHVSAKFTSDPHFSKFHLSQR